MPKVQQGESSALSCRATSAEYKHEAARLLHPAEPHRAVATAGVSGHVVVRQAAAGRADAFASRRRRGSRERERLVGGRRVFLPHNPACGQRRRPRLARPHGDASAAASRRRSVRSRMIARSALRAQDATR